MPYYSGKPRIIFFIGSLRSGGKERRLIELLTYLKEKDEFDMLVVMTKNEIHYDQFYKLNIKYTLIEKKWKRNDPTPFWAFYRICRRFDPDIIHSWGRMQTLYTVPAVFFRRKSLINSQITGAPVYRKKWSVSRVIDAVNFRFSSAVLANSMAGLNIFNPPTHKQKLIYNGINLKRFRNLATVDDIKRKYGIKTSYAVIMIASYTPEKNYRLFLDVASKVTSIRNDISFIGAGGFDKDDREYQELVMLTHTNPQIVFHSKIQDVESLINACNIGVLFSTNGEGISNTILEYMALGKPVIASNSGGTPELITHNVNGYLVENESAGDIARLIIDLVDDQEKAETFGINNRGKVYKNFTLENMGKAFENVYHDILTSRQLLLC